jgi:hypothetical protein
MKTENGQLAFSQTVGGNRFVAPFLLFDCISQFLGLARFKIDSKLLENNKGFLMVQTLIDYE